MNRMKLIEKGDEIWAKHNRIAQYAGWKWMSGSPSYVVSEYSENFVSEYVVLINNALGMLRVLKKQFLEQIDDEIEIGELSETVSEYKRGASGKEIRDAWIRDVSSIEKGYLEIRAKLEKN